MTNPSLAALNDMQPVLPADAGPAFGAENWSNTVHIPRHYESKRGIETMEAIAVLIDSKSGIEAFYLGNVLKYLTRYDRKGGTEDLEKARDYLERLIAENDHAGGKNSVQEVRI